MTDKYTIRDFLVYFITGLFLLVTLLYRFGISLLDFFRITTTDIKDNSALTIFLLIPGLYILGHFVHAIDLLLFKIGLILWDFKEKHSLCLKKCKIFWVFNFFSLVISGYRVSGILNAKKRDICKFWKEAHKSLGEGKSGNSEYWHLMNDLFKGLTLICISWTIFYFYESCVIHSFISGILVFLFWYRARHMAKNFVSTIDYASEQE